MKRTIQVQKGPSTLALDSDGDTFMDMTYKLPAFPWISVIALLIYCRCICWKKMMKIEIWLCFWFFRHFFIFFLTFLTIFKHSEKYFNMDASPCHISIRVVSDFDIIWLDTAHYFLFLRYVSMVRHRCRIRMDSIQYTICTFLMLPCRTCFKDRWRRTWFVTFLNLSIYTITIVKL